MKKPLRGSDTGKGRQLISDDDQALWRGTAITVDPIRRRSRVHPAAAPEGGEPADKPAPKPGKPAPKAFHRVVQHAPYVPKSTPEKAPPLNAFDERQAKKIRSGRLEIERRIDLHGMRQGEAHGALRRFLLKCHGEGARRVLVITGKGAPRRRGDDEAAWSGGQPGILKRQVPQWLDEPDLRAIVVGYTTAAIQHGGEGALYVQLRRNRD